MRTPATCVLLPILLACPLAAQSTTRVSVSSNGVQAYTDADAFPRISADGRRVVFVAADGLVPGDNDGMWDLLIHDRQTGSTNLLFVLPGGVEPDQEPYLEGSSSDMRFVSFSSYATNLVAGDTAGWKDVFVLDRTNGSIVRASFTDTGAEPDDDSAESCVSDDGRYVAFVSNSSSMVPNDNNGDPDIFLRDLLAGTTICVSRTPAGDPAGGAVPAISGDGRYVAYYSWATDIVAPDANGVLTDVFVYDRVTGTNALVSRSSAGVQGDQDCYSPALSRDGRFVTFTSYSTNLVAGDTNGAPDVFRRELTPGTTLRVSVTNAGAQANGPSFIPTISGDGSVVGFSSSATNLVAGDTNGSVDLFLRDVNAGTTERASVRSDGTQCTAATGLEILWPQLAANGRFVVFSSGYEGLVVGDDNQILDVFVRDRQSTVAPVTGYCTPKTNSQGCIPTIGATGEPRASGYDAFFVTATYVLNKKPGILLWSSSPSSAPFAGGTLCVGNPVTRTPVQSAGGSAVGLDCTGTYSFHFSQAYLSAHGLVGGTGLYTQYWSRDQGFAPPNNVGLTAGVQFTIAP